MKRKTGAGLIRGVALSICLTGFSVRAAELTWDTVSGDGAAVTGGSGSWSAGGGNWNTGADDTVWNNGNPDSAIFGGTAGTVSQSGDITAGSVTFASAGYLVTGGTLTLSGGTVTANADAAIGSVIAGSAGLAKNGAGVLTVSSAGTYIGATTVNAGSLRMGVSALPAPANLVHRWSFSGNANDSVGAMHLTVNAGVTFSGGAAVFDGGGTSYLSYVGNDIAAISAANRAITIEFWGTVQNNGYWARVYDIGADTSNYLFHNAGDGNDTRAIIKTGGGESGIFGGGGSIANGVPVHIVDVYDQDNNLISTYKNGSPVTTGSMGGQSLANIAAGNFYLGKAQYNDPYLKGSLTEVRVYNSALSAAQIAANFLSGADGFGFSEVGQLPPSAVTLAASGAALDLNDTAQAIDSLSGVAGSQVQLGLGRLTVGAAGDSSFAGTISDVGGASSQVGGSLVKTGGGKLTLDGNSTFTGATTVNGGTLSLVTGRLYASHGWGNAPVTVTGGAVLEVGAWGDSGSQSAGGLGQLGFDYSSLLLDGGTVRYSAVSADSGNMDRQFAIGAGGATLDANGGANVFTLNNTRFGVIRDNNNSLTLTGTGDGLLNTPFSGNGSLAKSGAGTWALSGANTYAGGTTVSDGTLQVGAGGTAGSLGVGVGMTLANSASVVFNRSDSLSVAQHISGTGSVVQNGSGTTVLGGVNTYAGATVINAGTLRVRGIVRAPDAPLAYTFADGSAENLGSIAALTTLGWTAPTFSTNGAPRAGLGVATMAGNDWGSYIDIRAASLPNLGGGANYTIAMWIKTAQAGAALLYKGNVDWWGVGNETFFLTTGVGNTGGWSGGHVGGVQHSGGFVGGNTDVNDGTWKFVAIVRSGGTSTMYVNGVADGTATDMARGEEGSQIIRLGWSRFNDGSAPFAGQISGTYIYDSALSAEQLVALKDGALDVDKALGVLPSDTAVSVASGATLDLGGVSQTVGALSGATGSSVVNNGALAVGGDGASTAFAGVISGAGSFTKDGAGVLSLSGTNSYAGATIVSNGTLRLTHALSLSKSTAVTLAEGAVLDLDFSGTQTVRSLQVGGEVLWSGVYSAARLPGIITGGGVLRTLEPVPEGTLILVM